jgi:hypothetical protein
MLNRIASAHLKEQERKLGSDKYISSSRLGLRKTFTDYLRGYMHPLVDHFWCESGKCGGM